jgi:hypothetical protein
MAKDDTQLQPPSSESREAGYEASTVSIKGLAIFLVCLVVVAALIHLGAWFLLKAMVTHDQHHDDSSSALTDAQFVDHFNQSHGSDAATSRSPLPPLPRLQPTPGQDPQNVPAADLEAMYEKEDALFNRMGWTIEKESHAQLGIPQSVISQVIQDESATQTASAGTGTAAPPVEGPSEGKP